MKNVRYIIASLVLSLAACVQTIEPETATPPAPTDSVAQATAASVTPAAPTPTMPTATAAETATATETPFVIPTHLRPSPTASPPSRTPTTTPTPWPTPSSLPLPMSQELTFEVVAHEGGRAFSVATEGNVAYVGLGPRLVMLDVTDPANVQPLARSPVLPGLVSPVLIGEDVVYAGTGRHLLVLQADDQGQLDVLAEVRLPGYVSHLIQADGMLYAAGSVPAGPEEQPTGFLAAVAPTEDNDLAFVDAPSLPAAASGIARDGDLLYVALDPLGPGPGELFVFDLDRGALLGEPATTRLPFQDQVHSLHMAGETLLVGGHMHLYALDTGDPAGAGSVGLEKRWQVDASPDLFLPMVEGMAVVGDTIYVVGNVPAGAYIPSRLAVPAPELLEGEGGSTTSPLVSLSNNRLFVTEGDSLQIYDVSQPGELVQIGGYGPFPTLMSTLAIEEPAPGEELLYLYSASSNDSRAEELFTFRLPDLQPLGYLSIEATNEPQLSQGALFDLLLHQNQAYAVARDGIRQIDISVHSAPRIIAHHPFTEGALSPRGLVAAGDTLYLSVQRPPQLAAISFDATGNSEQTGELARPLQGNNINDVTAAGDTLYLTTSEHPEGWLHTIDVSAGNPERLATLPLPGEPAWGILAADGTLLAVAVNEQLILIDVSAPDRPQALSAVTLPFAAEQFRSINALAFQEDLLFVIASSTLLAIDVSDPTAPRALGGFQLPNWGDHLAISGDTIVVGDGSMGVLVLRMNR
ncbi:MAG TPA: hypothetical protein VK879_14425 [Candidatus Sulfomarinibacteraceae bacterium]|nr:hypothetical protein [Candidatus Sulfomarinibacteraceae bacterium]